MILSDANQDDRPAFPDDGRRYPDAYALAGHLARRFGADSVIDIGLGSPRALMALSGLRKIVIDAGPHLEVWRPHFPDAQWIGWDLSAGRDLDLTDDTVSRSIVICTGTLERLVDPTILMTTLTRLWRSVPAMILTTPERDLRHSTVPMGPRRNPAPTREWNTAEFERLLGRHGLRPTFIGLTVDHESGEKNTLMSVFDHCFFGEGASPPDDFCPIALATTYNDVDIAAEIVAKLLDDGIEVVAYDNWSTDGTFELLTQLAARRSNLTVERFPEQGPSQYFDLRTICRMKEEVAATHPGRWIIHHDSDEIRCSPWAGISLRTGLYLVERMGYTAVDFTVCEFRPVKEGGAPGGSLERQIPHFEYSQVPADFDQIKVWRQGAERVVLASSAGHHADFPGRKVFPYKFLLKHYPLRSTQQAQRKIFGERIPRYAPAELDMGWHDHYNDCRADQRFVWDAADLIDFEAPATRRTYLLESIAGIGIVRGTAEPVGS